MKNSEVYKKVRKSWLINPRIRIKASKKIYNRQLTKKEIQQIKLKEEI